MEIVENGAGGISGVVELSIPPRPEFVAVARLAVSGVASRLSFGYEEIEDIKLAVAEACTSAIQHAALRRSFSALKIICRLGEGNLQVDVIDGNGTFKPQSLSSLGMGDERGLGIFLIESLMDDVSYEELQDGSTLIRMTKILTR